MYEYFMIIPEPPRHGALSLNQRAGEGEIHPGTDGRPRIRK